ncbi:ASKHA domain-containing protein [Chloroflexota bacterium]
MTKKSAQKNLKVHFEPDNTEVLIEPGANLLEAAIDAGVRITASCGGAGVCGTCKVVIKSGEVDSIRTDKVSDKEWGQGTRQACQSKVLTDLSVHVPVESRLERAVVARERKGMGETVATGWKFRPLLSKYYLELPAPTLEDNASDLSRLLRGLKQRHKLTNMTVDFDVVRKLPHTLRDGKWKVTATTLVTATKPKTADRRRPRLTNVEAGDTRNRHYSLAFDIGTTTVCGQLLDLNKGLVMAEDIDYNAQISYGQDVISRIAYCQKGGCPKLQKAVVGTINGIIQQLLDKSGIDRQEIGHLAVAGNTTMIQILLGLDPQYIRLAPYTPAATFIPPVKGSEMGIEVGDHVYLFTFPLVASYIGGDINAGIVGAGVHQRSQLTYYIDIGTNGEIVVGNSDWLVAAACSAGPAFEGGGIKHGMVATTGAIEDFDIDPSNLEPNVDTIGGEKPKGVCGSGLINIIAALLETGVIGQNGKFHTDLPTNRVRPGKSGHEYVLAWASETQTGNDIVITEADIDNFIRAKAAMYAGCQTLVNSVGMSCCSELEQVIIAGSFGSHIDIEKGITIGLFPDIPRDRFTFIGNGSLLGARLTSFSTDLLDDARNVARMTTNLELSENNDFMKNYIAALFLPHTNADEFPSVKEKLEKLQKNKLKQRTPV